MIDLHSHILPAADDGAGNLEESIKMAELAVEDGIRVVVATPHHNNGMYRNERESIICRVEELSAALSGRGIPLQVISGQELRLTERSMQELLDGNETLTINHSRYLLVELPSHEIPERLEDWLHEMQVAGIVPVLAHPERNKVLMRRPDVLRGIVEQGGLVQITAQSLAGGFGKQVRHTALRFCRDHLVHLIASDAHNTDTRPFLLTEAFRVIDSELGEEYRQLYLSNAQNVLDNFPVNTLFPVKTEKRRLFFWRKKD